MDLFDEEVVDLGPFNTGRTTAAGAPVFVAASQNTTVTNDRFAGSGSVSAHATGNEIGELLMNFAQSELDMQFTLTRTMPLLNVL